VQAGVNVSNTAKNKKNSPVSCHRITLYKAARLFCGVLLKNEWKADSSFYRGKYHKIFADMPLQAVCARLVASVLFAV